MTDGDVSIYSVTRDLDAKAVTSRKDELVRVDTEIEAIRSDKRQANIEFNERLKPLEKRQKELLVAIRNKREEFDVECVANWDYGNKVVRYLRKDTGEEVDTTPMGPEELQEDLAAVQGGQNTNNAKPKAKAKK